jgi:hypothetical protein
MTRGAGPSSAASPIIAGDEDAFLRAYARRCRALDLVGSGTLMALLMVLATPKAGSWLVEPHGVSLLLLAYSAARWLHFRGRHSKGSGASGPAQRPQQPQRDKGAASSSGAGAAGPSQAAAQAGGGGKPESAGAGSSGLSRQLLRALAVLLDDRSRHYVMTGILVLQPLVLLVGGPGTAGPGGQGSAPPRASAAHLQQAAAGHLAVCTSADSRTSAATARQVPLLLERAGLGGAGGALPHAAAQQVVDALLLHKAAFPLELPRLSFCVPVGRRAVLPVASWAAAVLLSAGMPGLP